MPDRDTPGSPPDSGERPDQTSTERYEPPQIEDLEATEGSSATAAGVPTRTAAPRRI